MTGGSVTVDCAVCLSWFDPTDLIQHARCWDSAVDMTVRNMWSLLRPGVFTGILIDTHLKFEKSFNWNLSVSFDTRSSEC